MRHKMPIKTFPLLIICLLAVTGCPASRATRGDQTPPDVKLVVTFTNLATGKTEIHQAVSPHTTGDVSVKVNVPAPPLPPEEAKGVEIRVKAIATDSQGVSHLRIMRTAAPGMRWKGKPPAPINRFSDDAQSREELGGTLVLLQKGSTITLFAEAYNFASADSGRSQTAKLTISTK
ncbi:MAG: hypothetical protein ACE5MG_03345 [Candidatus Methylomirabilales bacterium]